MKALWPPELLVVAMACTLVAYDISASEQSDRDIEEILKLHRALLESHVKYDVDGVLASESDQPVVVSRGEIRFPSKSDRFQQYERYLKNVEFEEYRDLVSPIVRVSDDGTLGWLIAQVEIVGTQTSSDGERMPVDAIWAWIELYEKQDGRWMRIGEVSSRMPSDP